MKIWLDDIRPAPDTTWKIVKNFAEFKKAIALYPTHIRIVEISFDNDLGPDSEEGWEIANWLLDQVQQEKLLAPVNLHVHSANVAARPRIRATLDHILHLGNEIAKRRKNNG